MTLQTIPCLSLEQLGYTGVTVSPKEYTLTDEQAVRKIPEPNYQWQLGQGDVQQQRDAKVEFNTRRSVCVSQCGIKEAMDIALNNGVLQSMVAPCVYTTTEDLM